MKRRSAEFVRYVWNHPGKTPHELSERFSVSMRSIRAWVADANASLSGAAALELGKDRGYRLAIFDGRLCERILDEAGPVGLGKVSATSEERVRYMVSELVLRDGWARLEDYARYFYVSRSCVSADLKKVATFCEPHGVVIESRPRYGVRAVGSEVARRACLAANILGEVLEDDPGLVLGENTLILNAATSAVSRVAADKRYRVYPAAVQALVIHLAVAIYRIRQGCGVDLDLGQSLPEEDSQAFAAANEMCGIVSESLEIEFPLAEKRYLAVHLAGKEVPAEGGAPVSDAQLAAKLHVRGMLETIRSVYQIDLCSDELEEGLVRHVAPLISRLRHGTELRNPLAQDTRARFPLAFAMARDFAAELSQASGVPVSDDETGWLALHFALALEQSKLGRAKKNMLVVSASGTADARLLGHLCRREFGDLVGSVAVCDISQLDGRDLTDVDLVLSTAPLPRELPVPVRVVRRYFNGNDLAQVKESLKSRPLGVWSGCVERELFFPHMRWDTRDEAIAFLCSRIIERHDVSHDFEELVIAREEALPTPFGTGVAMPHPLRATSEQLHVAVGIADEPFEWGGERVRLVILVSIPRTKVTSEFFGALADVLMSPESVDEIVRSQDFETFRGLLDSALNNQ